MAKEWKLPKRKQPIWRVTRKILAPGYETKNIEFEEENGKFPDKCIIVSNHNNKKGPMVYEISLPVYHVTWGAYQMLGSYKERFKYLRDVLYMQKNGFSKTKANLKAWFEAIFSIYFYRGMKILPSYPDMRFRKTLKYSMDALDAGYAVSVYPEDSSKGYFDEMTEFFPGFVVLAQTYYNKRGGEDIPIFPVYLGRDNKKIVVGKPMYVQEFVKQGLDKFQIADRFKDAVNDLYKKYFR